SAPHDEVAPVIKEVFDGSGDPAGKESDEGEDEEQSDGDVHHGETAIFSGRAIPEFLHPTRPDITCPRIAIPGFRGAFVL
ncbi:MAG: hypothetical protein QF723_04215, partial [Phycisphaerales bacterium]|nr:hypothetical protein [Phycisphaerales bacterium]